MPLKTTRLFPTLILVLLLLTTTTLNAHTDMSMTADASTHVWHDEVIQPGATLASGDGGTLGFLFQSTSQSNPEGVPIIYASSHGHGTMPEVGEPVHLWNGPLVGEVVAKRYERGDDWALIEIAPDSHEYVDYSVRYWTGPTGVADPEDIRLDDTLCHYGAGTGWSLHAETKPRCGQLNGARYVEKGLGKFESYPMTASSGDSGSPMIHHETGQALGILLSVEPVQNIVNSIDICTLIQRFSDHGFDVELATADYDPPEAKPVPPNPWAAPVIGPFRGLSTQCLGG